MSTTPPVAEGITNPPIDELLTQSDSKYKLVLFAAKRARQINAYYSQLGEGLLEYVGPLVETAPQEKPLSIALREVNTDLIEFGESDEPVDTAGTTDNDAAVLTGDGTGFEAEHALGDFGELGGLSLAGDDTGTPADGDTWSRSVAWRIARAIELPACPTTDGSRLSRKSSIAPSSLVSGVRM